MLERPFRPFEQGSRSMIGPDTNANPNFCLLFTKFGKNQVNFMDFEGQNPLLRPKFDEHVTWHFSEPKQTILEKTGQN